MARGAVAVSGGCVYAWSASVGELHREVGIGNQDVVEAGSAGTLFVVADGHGPAGELVAAAAARALVKSGERGLAAPDTASGSAPLCALLATAFADAADAVDAMPEAAQSGATAAALVVRGGYAAVANVGDTLVVVCREGVSEVLTECHRTSNQEERRRVQECGGIVQSEYLCDKADLPTKMISVTRALGDLDVRSIGVCASPAVRAAGLVEEDDFFVVASDGLWDAHGGDITPTVAADVVKRNLDSAGKDVQLAFQKSADMLLALATGTQSHPLDDTTVLVVRPPPPCPEPQ